MNAQKVTQHNTINRSGILVFFLRLVHSLLKPKRILWAYFHCQINHGFSLRVTLVSLLFLWVFRASDTRPSRDSVCLFKQTNLGFRPLSPSNAALDQWTILLLLSLCSCVAEATLWPSPQNQMPKLQRIWWKHSPFNKFNNRVNNLKSHFNNLKCRRAPRLMPNKLKLARYSVQSFLFYFSFLCAAVLGVFVFGSWFSFVAFYYAFRFFVHLLMVWVCHVLCVSLAFSVALCSRPARIVSLFPGLFIFVYSRFAPCTLCFAHLGILFCYFALSAYLCLSR